VRTYLKAVYFIGTDDSDLIASTGFAVLTPGRDVIPRYLSFLAQSSHFTDRVSADSVGTLYPAIAEGRIAAFQVAVPQLSEQSSIVRYLDHVDRRIRRYIRAKQKLIALLNEQKQAIIHRAVTRGLDPNVRLKPSGLQWLGDIPEHWESRPAKYFYREVDERSRTGDEEMLSVSHITGVTPRSQKSVTMFLAESNVGHKLCRPGDVVINTMWAWMAALGVAGQAGIVSPSYAVYRPIHGDGFIAEFVDALLRTKPYVAEYVCRSTGIRGSRLRLYPESFLKIPLVRPSVEEQGEILSLIKRETSRIDEGIAEMRSQVELIQDYRTRLISDVVTGKLDVREAAAGLPDETDASDTSYTSYKSDTSYLSDSSDSSDQDPAPPAEPSDHGPAALSERGHP
jgi:type I restriction enzyme S subunit